MDTLSELFESDSDKATNGVPIVIGYNSLGEEVVFYIAEAGNPVHVKAQRKYAKQLEVSRKSPKQTEKILRRIVAESILTKWTGVLDENNNVVEPTFENKLDALTKYKKAYHRVLEESNEHDNFSIIDHEELPEDMSEEDVLEDTEKN